MKVIQVSAKGRKRMITLLCILCWTEASLGLILVALTVIPLTITHRYLNGLKLILNTVFQTELLCGISTVLISFGGAIVSRAVIESSVLESTKKAYVIWCTLSSFFVVFIVIAIFTLPTAFNSGMDELSYCLERGMREYLHEPHWKVMIDDLQQGLECCGFKSYEDWFKIIWIPVQSVRTDLDPVNSPVKEDGSLLVPIVPHSCCKPEVKIPCLHDTLQQNDTISQWSAGGAAPPFRDSIYIEGCQGGLLKGMMGALISFSFITALIIMLQVSFSEVISVGVLIIAKYLQDFTSNRVYTNEVKMVESEKQPLTEVPII